MGRFAIVTCLTAVVALLIFVAVLRSVPIAEYRRTACVHACVMWVGVCVAAIASRFGTSKLSRQAVPMLLLGLCVGDALVTTRLSQITMYGTSPEQIARWNDLDHNHVSSVDLTNNGLRRELTANLTNDQMITKVPVFDSYATSVNQFYAEMVQDPILRRPATGSKRIWFAEQALQIPLTASSFAAFARVTKQRGAPVLVVHSREQVLNYSVERQNPGNSTEIGDGALTRLPEIKEVDVGLLKYSNKELVFTVQCPADGWLLVTDRWSRSWEAQINDKAVPVYAGNFVFRAVRVSRGMNMIRFSYHPFGFPWLVLTSWASLGGVAIFSVYSRTRQPVQAGLQTFGSVR
jgi:hypothetical protein